MLGKLLIEKGVLPKPPEMERAERLAKARDEIAKVTAEEGLDMEANPREFARRAAGIFMKHREEGGANMAIQWGETRYALKLAADKERATIANLEADTEAKKRGGGAESPFAKITPKDYTNASLRQFLNTGDQSTLVPRETPEDADKALDRDLKRAEQLRGEFIKQSKDFVGVRDSYGRIQEAAKDPSAAGDLAMVFNYMKMLDPNSVVRESEFATAQNSAGVPERIRAMYNRTLNGERLSDVTRNDFEDRSNRLYARQLKSHESLEQQYGKLAKRSGVSSEAVVLDYRLTKMDEKEDEKPAAGGVQEGATATNKAGEKIIFKGGKWQPLK
jgi:hypothetical protein